jgi:hypothetical protein
LAFSICHLSFCGAARRFTRQMINVKSLLSG